MNAPRMPDDHAGGYTLIVDLCSPAFWAETLPVLGPMFLLSSLGALLTIGVLLPLLGAGIEGLILLLYPSVLPLLH